MTEPATTWLPNLVGGVSIWKLARDLNAPHLFDGRLLVPDAEGADSLPTRVTWNLGGLVPLSEARTSAPEEVGAAIRDLLARLEKVGLELKDPASGFHRFKDAFTVPGLEADGGAHYYFDPRSKKLCVINWGASPRAIAGAQSLVFGWQSFDKVGGAAVAAVAIAGAAAAARAASPDASPQGAALAAGAPVVDEKPKEGKKDEKKAVAPALLWGRPWWHWLLALLAAAAIVALVLYLLHACNEPLGPNGADASGSEAASALEGGALADGPGDARLDGEAGPADGSPDANLDGTRDGFSEGAAESATDGPSDARVDGAGDAKTDGKTDGALMGAGGGGSGVGVGVGPGNGVGVGVGVGGHDPNALPHRFHFEPEAVRWRVSAGQNMLDSSSPVEGIGQNFEVILKPGGSFDGVKVQWQDASGHWHQ